VASAVSHLADLWDSDKAALVRPLKPDEARFIQNERRLSALDFDYWGLRYARIIAWDKTSQPFTPNVAQSIVLSIWADLESRALPVSMQQLKARQLGVSTLTELAVAHRVQFHPRVNAVVASSDPQKSEKLARIIAYCWEQQPWWLLPAATRYKNNMPAEFGELHSSLLVQSGNQFTGVARGDTPNVAHLSELCEWDNPDDLVDASLLRAMHETPDLFLVLESTALGRGNWWHRTWKISKHDWDLGRARLCPIFLPWFVGCDIYPTPTWLRMRPIPPIWTPSDLVIRHAERARQYVLANPLLFEHLAQGNRDWQMPRAQLWFYEVERDQAIKKNALNKFLQEMPADDQEAFQSTNISAISSEIVLAYREKIPPPAGVYTIAGPFINPEHVISRRMWDSSKPPITIRTRDVLPSLDEVYQFIPLKFTGYPETDPTLRLFIWEFPEANETYGVGVDTSDGVGLDGSVLEVVRRGTRDRLDAQVAEFASSYIKANQLWPMTLALACFYSTFHASRQRRVPCKVAVECRGNGEVVQFEMKKRGWPNFHPWLRYDQKKLVHPGKAVKDGVFTNQWFRSQMMDLMLTSIDEETLEIASPWLVEEMEALERDEFKQSLKAAHGEHDDRFMALGFIHFSQHVLDIPGRQYSRRSPSYAAPIDDPDIRPVYAVYRAPLQAQSGTGVIRPSLLPPERHPAYDARQAAQGRGHWRSR
jgi:hypothetical protein